MEENRNPFALQINVQTENRGSEVKEEPKEEESAKVQEKDESNNVQINQEGNDQNPAEEATEAAEGASGGKKLYYKYCCNSCIHLQNSNKSCVCIVPRSKRKKTIGEEGCQTCKCTGCTAEDDLIRNEQERRRKNGQNVHRQRDHERSRSRDKESFKPQNGCCRKCLKALSKNKKACLCQVPKRQRKTKLPSEGCKLCGCHGCHPRDGNNYEYSSDDGHYSNYSVDDRSDNEEGQNFNNVQNSIIGKVVVSEYGLYAPMLGLGIPQRSASYILGRPI